MSKHKTPQEALRAEILKICKGQFRSLGDFCEILQANKNTIRSRYLYPMVREGILIQEYPSGTKASQRYKTATESELVKANKESRWKK